MDTDDIIIFMCSKMFKAVRDMKQEYQVFCWFQKGELALFQNLKLQIVQHAMIKLRLKKGGQKNNKLFVHFHLLVNFNQKLLHNLFENPIFPIFNFRKIMSQPFFPQKSSQKLTKNLLKTDKRNKWLYRPSTFAMIAWTLALRGGFSVAAVHTKIPDSRGVVAPLVFSAIGVPVATLEDCLVFFVDLEGAGDGEESGGEEELHLRDLKLQLIQNHPGQIWKKEQIYGQLNRLLYFYSCFGKFLNDFSLSFHIFSKDMLEKCILSISSGPKNTKNHCKATRLLSSVLKPSKMKKKARKQNFLNFQSNRQHK